MRRIEKRKVPDDVVLFMCCLFAAILYLWCNINGVKSGVDLYLLMFPVGVLILVPLCYSMYVKRKG